jgi:hypothetical protein
MSLIIQGADLRSPIEITDLEILANFNVWTGPRTFSTQPGFNANAPSFIIDWSQGTVSSPPKGLPLYEVSFYVDFGDKTKTKGASQVWQADAEEPAVQRSKACPQKERQDSHVGVSGGWVDGRSGIFAGSFKALLGNGKSSLPVQRLRLPSRNMLRRLSG